jgi:hypothetical protein
MLLRNSKPPADHDLALGSAAQAWFWLAGVEVVVLPSSTVGIPAITNAGGIV